MIVFKTNRSWVKIQAQNVFLVLLLQDVVFGQLHNRVFHSICIVPTVHVNRPATRNLHTKTGQQNKTLEASV